MSVLLIALALSAWGTELPKKLLVVTVTTGFRHSSIPMAEKVIEQLAIESGKFTVDFVHQPADQSTAAAALEKLSLENLKRYNGVLFASTTGDLPLPDPQGFIDWIASGHAFVGVHAAADTFHNFPPYIAMLGGEFLTHGPQVSVDCINQDSHHTACASLSGTWTLFDEIYQFKNFDRTKVHELLTLDKHPNTHAPGNYPVAWCKNHGSGRVFYTSLGHRADVWHPAETPSGGRKNPTEVSKQFQQHLLGGILWALELAQTPATQ